MLVLNLDLPHHAQESSMSIDHWEKFLSTESITFPLDGDKKSSTEVPSPWETFTNAAVLSQLAYEPNPVEAFENHRDRYKTNLVLVKVINPQSLVEQRIVMGIAQQSGTNVLTIYFAIRGFDNIVRFITKFTSQPSLDDLDLHVHRGFYEEAKSIPDEIICAYLKHYPCVITGHSLGGAISTLVGIRILRNSHCSNYINVWENTPKESSSENNLTGEGFLKLSGSSRIFFSIPMHNVTKLPCSCPLKN